MQMHAMLEFWQILCANVHDSCLLYHGFTNAFACWMMCDNQNWQTKWKKKRLWVLNFIEIFFYYDFGQFRLSIRYYGQLFLSKFLFTFYNIL
jgi:hypothetical protein